MDIHISLAQTLKEKRSVVKSLKDRLHNRFNVGVSEVEPNETWQRCCLGIAAVASERAYVEGLLREVSEWLHEGRWVNVIRIQEEYLSTTL
ncbi:MAG: DUF503 domain-containing protein [Candidatus Omnitrophica bacterium]|nr:DUF503 domain-containing protein [Candidatus Omnitrophota bacterium]